MRLAATLGLGLALLTSAAAATPGLARLDHVAVRVEQRADGGELSVELERRIAGLLREASRPAPRVDPSSSEVLQLVVGIRAVGATTLRGFYLPFSGTYAVGPVRLALRRPASVAGASEVIATVWEEERLAAVPWPRRAAEIRRLADELVAAFLDAYRAAAR